MAAETIKYEAFYELLKGSGVPGMYLWSFSSKYPTDHLLYHFENAYFEWKQKHAVFRACLFKCKWAAALRPFSRIELCHYSLYLLKNICFGLDYHVYHAEIMRFKPY